MRRHSVKSESKSSKFLNISVYSAKHAKEETVKKISFFKEDVDKMSLMIENPN